jgi:cobalt-zinc-cadmium resistance protein CzcA
MFQKIIALSLRNKALVLLATTFIVAAGINSVRHIPLDAVPDITNNQVQVVTISPSLSGEEVEKFITHPVELAMANVPGRQELRSISRYGLSVVTVVFEDDVPQMLARQYVSEQILLATENIPPGMGTPELMPITTGLGEVYQYVLEVDDAYKNLYNLMDLRTIQDWIVKRQLGGIKGIVEISTFGGYLRQYEVAVDPMRLNALELSIEDVIKALEINQGNTGGGYVEQGPSAIYIRSEGIITSLDQLEIIPVSTREGQPILVRDLATVNFAPALRYGAMTMDGKGEVVGGITLMLKGANSYEVVNEVKQRIEKIQKSLPPGIHIYPYLDRTELIQKTISTASTNLIEGGIIVILVLLLLLGNWRASIIVASVIPLSMLFALIMMRQFGVSANLMSLGAIDFGIVVDGAVIIIEATLFSLHHKYIGRKISSEELDDTVNREAGKVFGKAAFGILIILVVFLPILALSGIEGKMFRPMSQTVSFALLGALILSLTYVPVMTSLFLGKNVKPEWKLTEIIMRRFKQSYLPILSFSLKYPRRITFVSALILVLSLGVFSRMGSEFLPSLEEGDLAMQMTIRPGSSLSESVALASKAEKVLKDNFPEVEHVISKIGTAEIPTDPMAIEDADIMIILKEKDEWTSAENREELVELMKEELEVVLGASFEFTQPIQLRFNELLSGAKSDIAVQIFGDDHNELFLQAKKVEKLVKDIEGVGDIKVEQTEGLPQMIIRMNREQMSRYGVSVVQVNTAIRGAFAGEVVGTAFDNEKRFDVVVRMGKEYRTPELLEMMKVENAYGKHIPLAQLITVSNELGPMQISRENTRRRINIGINVRNRDMGSLVNEIRTTLSKELRLPAGYNFEIAGQYENYQNATKRLKVAVPIALALILVLLYFAFNSFKYALLIFTAVPLSAVGGIFALYLRDMPFSISAGVGFIALFGVAVLNGIVLISHITELQKEMNAPLKDIVFQATQDRLRPVLITAAVAIMGFIPMALSHGAGAEVQKPLASVVIGGLISATFLTMVVLPALFVIFEKKRMNLNASALVLMGILMSSASFAQEALSLEKSTQLMLANNPEWLNAAIDLEQARAAKGQTLAFEPLDLSYTRGQIDNLDKDDYNFSISQDFGSLLAHVRRNQEFKSLEAYMQSMLQLKERELRYELKMKYQRWVYAYQRLQLARSEFQRFEELGRVMDNQLQAGLISTLEWNRNRSQLHQFSAALLREENNYREATRQINDLILYGNPNIIPSESTLSPVLLTPDSALAGILTLPASYKVEWKEARAKTISAEIFPSVNAGYFNQEIASDRGLQGFSVGVRIPLWFLPQQSLAKQERLEAQKFQNEYNALQSRFQNALVQHWRNYDAYRERWQGLLSEAMVNAETLQASAEAGFMNGETDYFHLAQSIETALQLKFTYLENLYLMNETAIKIEFLVNYE